MSRIVRPPTEAPRRFPSGACHGARPEEPILYPPIPPAGGASRRRGRGRGRTFEAAEPELLQPGEGQERSSRTGSPGASRARAAAHAGGPISQAPPAMEEIVRHRTLPRHVSIGSPASGAARPGASVAFAEGAVKSFTGRCTRPAGVDERVAARPTALINCGSSVGRRAAHRQSWRRTPIRLGA